MTALLRKRLRSTTVMLAGVTLLVACGSGSGGSSPAATGAETPQRGGTLNLLGSGDVDYMDPNLSYYSLGYLALRGWSRQPYTYPADPQKSTTAVPDLATDMPIVSKDGKTVTITIRQGAQWDTSPPRQVTAEDEIRGIKRTCNPAQPFGGLPDYEDLIVGFQAFCDGFAKVGQTASAIAGYMNSHDVAGLKVGSDDRTVVFTLTHPAAYFADMLTLTAFSPAPKEYDAFVPASAQLAQHDLRRALHDTDLRRHQADRHGPQPGLELEQRPDPQGLRGQDRDQRDRHPGEHAAAAADRDGERGHGVRQLPAAVAAAGADLQRGPELQPRRDRIEQPVHRLQRELAEQRRRDGQAGLPPGAHVRDQPSAHHPGPRRPQGQPTADPHPAERPGRRDSRLRPVPVQRRQGEAAHRPGRLPERRDAEVPLPQRFRGQQQDLRDRPAGPQAAGHHGGRGAGAERRLLHEVPAGAQRGDARGLGPVTGGWGADWYGNGALSFFNPLYSGKPSFRRRAATTVRRRRHQPPDLPGPLGDHRGPGRQLWHKADQR